MKTQINLLILFLCLSFSQIVTAQKPTASMLPSPTDWRLEKIDFPLNFAPTIAFQGTEELRFAPGMFDRTSATYFTYIFAIAIENNVTLNEKELHTFLLAYYRGLSSAVAKSKKLTIDTSQIKVVLKKSEATKNHVTNYNVTLDFLDTFNNGEKVVLQMELEVIKYPKSKKSYIVVLVSPTKKTSTVWKKLHEIRKTVVLK